VFFLFFSCINRPLFWCDPRCQFHCPKVYVRVSMYDSDYRMTNTEALPNGAQIFATLSLSVRAVPYRVEYTYLGAAGKYMQFIDGGLAYPAISAWRPRIHQ